MQRAIKELSIDKNKWEELAIERFKWRTYLQATLDFGEKNIITALENKHRVKKDTLKPPNFAVANTVTNGLDP